MFVESGHAVCYLGNAKKQTLRDGTFYAEDPFITTLAMMVEENGDFNVAATSDTQRMYGLQAVSDCHCLELGIKDVFEAFEGNRDVLRLLTRCKCPEQRNTHSRASASASQQGRCARCAARMLANAHPGAAPRNRAHTTPFPPTPPFPSICVFFPRAQ